MVGWPPPASTWGCDPHEPSPRPKQDPLPSGPRPGLCAAGSGPPATRNLSATELALDPKTEEDSRGQEPDLHPPVPRCQPREMPSAHRGRPVTATVPEWGGGAAPLGPLLCGDWGASRQPFERPPRIAGCRSTLLLEERAPRRLTRTIRISSPPP